LILISSSFAQVPTAPTIPEKKDELQKPAEQAPSGVHELTAADVSAFLDALIPLQLKEHDIAGAAVSIVKDGQILFARGYGYADVEKKKPVSPQETLFRPGSVSKLFTWTAVMQMFEQGKLNLDADVNTYLDFKIPDAFDKPITLKNILTHTPGFEEQIKDLFVPGSASPDLGQYLKTHIPKRIFPPGKVPAYSNYATALAGYIVERVSGQPFTDYIDQNIFKPLGMTHSTFAQPLPSNLAPLMSNGYRKGSDGPQAFEMVGAFPAGSLSSSATDMAHFMLAHLQDGQLAGNKILTPETTRLMHNRLFALDDAANAMCYGFYEESRNGHRIIGHGGDTVYFHSDLHLILDAKVGFFISYNSAGKGEVSNRSVLWEAFLNRYFPYTVSAPALSGSAKEDAKTVSGAYMLSRRSDSFLKAASLLGEFKVSPAGEGMIEVAELTHPSGKAKRWRGVAANVFQEEDGQDKLIFKPDENGSMQMVLPYPFFVGHRVGFFENKSLLLPVLGFSVGIMLLTLLLWPVSWLVRRHYGHRLEFSTVEKLLRLGVRVVFVLNLIFIIGLLALATYGLTHLEVFSDKGSRWFHLLQVIGIIGGVGTLVVLLNAIVSWFSSRRRIWGKLQTTVMVLASIGLLWFAFAAKLFHITSNY
jgi:CubicO group peptidase (beta-lactamase class C family)